MPLAEAVGAICVQRFDDSRNSAIHTTYRISLRSSSLQEPRYPLLRVCHLTAVGRAVCKTSVEWFCVWVKERYWGKSPPNRPAELVGPMADCRQYEPHHCGTAVARSTPNRPLAGPDGGTHDKGHRCGFDRFNDPSAGSPRVSGWQAQEPCKHCCQHYYTNPDGLSPVKTGSSHRLSSRSGPTIS